MAGGMLYRSQPVERRRRRLNGWTWLGVGLLMLSVLGWVAIRVRPAPFPSVTHIPTDTESQAIPRDLPVPVERFLRMRYGDRIPVVDTAVITGRGTMRVPQLLNLTFPARFRFIHEAGKNYRHYIEITLFGLPVLSVNEHYRDGVERQELPWAVATGNPKLDQGGNVGMWAEIIQWMPSVLATDPNVRWEAVDNETALLVVPFGETEERFVVRFDPGSGDILYWEVMRYANGTGEKTLWVNGTWFEDGRPWFIVSEDEVVFNVEVDTSMTAKGASVR